MKKYKNVTDNMLKFRAYDKSGQKTVFELKPNEEFETEYDVLFGGLEVVKEPRSKKKEENTKFETIKIKESD